MHLFRGQFEQCRKCEFVVIMISPSFAILSAKYSLIFFSLEEKNFAWTSFLLLKQSKMSSVSTKRNELCSSIVSMFLKYFPIIAINASRSAKCSAIFSSRKFSSMPASLNALFKNIPNLHFMLVPKCKSGRIICNSPCKAKGEF